jgi:hypothetical protein
MEMIASRRYLPGYGTYCDRLTLWRFADMA